MFLQYIYVRSRTDCIIKLPQNSRQIDIDAQVSIYLPLVMSVSSNIGSDRDLKGRSFLPKQSNSIGCLNYGLKTGIPEPHWQGFISSRVRCHTLDIPVADQQTSKSGRFVGRNIPSVVLLVSDMFFSCTQRSQKGSRYFLPRIS